MNTASKLVPDRSFNFLPRARQLLAALALAGVISGSAMAGETSFKHSFMMRGQVLEAKGGTLVLCVGKQDGAEVGQVLEVVRHVRTSSGSKKANPRYRRDDVGTVKITSLFDEHYAMAVVVKGSPKASDTVELRR